jgi:translation elongation factor EF-4
MPALHRDVLRRHTGRQRKPLDKQKESGTMRPIGEVDIPRKVFIAARELEG